MERRIALAAAGATAGTLGLGTICFAAVGGSNILGMASAQAPTEVDVITEVQEIQRVVVVRSSSTTLPGGTTIPTVVLEVPVPVPAAPAPVATPTPATPAPRPAIPASTLAPTTSRPVVTVVQVPVTAAPTTAKPTTTTAKPVTTTTWPAGVPRDWPVGKPIPSKPANCEDAQLELNGVWNCDD